MIDPIAHDDLTNISLILSRVMDDVGLNEECVMRHRRANLLRENLHSLFSKMYNRTITYHILGSQTEGTTTEGLNSDIDVLIWNEYINVIQDWKDWAPGKLNYLMMRDERRYPGYCKLKLLRTDAPLALYGNVNGHYMLANDRDGSIILKHDGPSYSDFMGHHGPARTRKEEGIDSDLVFAFKCETWPKHYQLWSSCHKRREWPTSEMVQHIKATGCFVVKVDHPLDEENETWRISTCLAERCLMFSLNITQVRCYVLLKMIVKTFIDPHIPDTISSYICKTLLFHVIENTNKGIWKERNLLKCVHNVLLYMASAVLDENCPNYFNDSANLFLEKVDSRNKKKLLSKVRTVLKTRWMFLFKINIDDINRRLSTYIIHRNREVFQQEADITKLEQYRQILRGLNNGVCFHVSRIIVSLGSNVLSINNILQKIRNFIKKGTIQLEAAHVVLPFLCSCFATVEGSRSLRERIEPTPLSLKLFDLSQDSDVTSSRLKFASYLYCAGKLDRALSVLEDVEQRITDSVWMHCGCHTFTEVVYPHGFGQREIKQKYPSTSSLAMSVMFSKAEIQCCPRELQYELFRSTEKEKCSRKLGDYWMDTVVMDSLPYLYFLQYMAYCHLGQRDRQKTAIDKLCYCIRENKNIVHIETAMNAIG